MAEKIKDLLYDLTDFGLVLIILIVMISVISLKVTDSFSIDLVHIFSKNSIDNEIAIDISEKDNGIELSNITIKPEIKDTEVEIPEEIIIVPEETTNNEKPEETITNNNVKITIKNGTTGYGIAKLLKENSLIDDTQPFITRVEDLKLGAKLLSGTFSLNTSQSLDEIIYTIAGKN